MSINFLNVEVSGPILGRVDSFKFVEALELHDAVSKRVDGCYRKHFSHKEGVLTFGVTLCFHPARRMLCLLAPWQCFMGMLMAQFGWDA
jgi:hypothetical protein